MGALQLASVLIAILVACLYLAYGIDRSLWLDEANSVHIASGPPGRIIDALSRDVSPPLYYFLLSGWMRSFGDSEIALRLLSALFYLAGICLMWHLGRMLLGTEGAASTSFLFAVNPIMGRHVQNVRMYTMVAMMVALSMIVFVILTRDRERRTFGWFALFGLTALVGLNTHYWFAFVLVGYGCWVIFTRHCWSAKELCLLGAFTALPFFVLDLAMFLRQSNVPATLWTPHPTVGQLIHAMAAELGLVQLRSSSRIVSAIVLGAPIVWALVMRRRDWQPAMLRSALFPGSLYAVALGVPFLISMRRPIFYPGRYDIIAVPFFVLFAACLLLALPAGPRVLFQLLLACVCGFQFFQLVRHSQTTNWLETPDPVPLGDRAAAQAICAQSAPGDFVVYTGLSRAAVSFYLERFGCSGKVKQVSYPAEFAQHLGWEDPRRNYSQEPALKREGESVAADAYSSGARVFLLLHREPRLSAGIVTPIEHLFRTASSQRFESCEPCFGELRVYAPNSVNLKGDVPPDPRCTPPHHSAGYAGAVTRPAAR
jgi:uncharacterized membrane protein YbaN (DUF454 family)